MSEDAEICVTMDDVQAARKRIREGSVDKCAVETPLLEYDNLSKMCGCDLFFKLEVFQRCKAFKFRGALNKLKTLPEGTTVCCCSAGNHSQGVALAASICNCKSIIFMPSNASSAKVQATQHYGGEVRQVGDSFDAAKKACEDAVKEHPEWVFVPPYNDREIIAGTATIGCEIIEQCPEVQTIVVPIGGGGLISGVAYAAKTLKPSVRIIGVQMASCPAAYKAYHENKHDSMPASFPKEPRTPLADGIAVKSPGPLNLAIIHKYVDDVVIVTEDEVAVAVALLAERGKVVSEGAGATPLAAIMNKKFSFAPDEKIVGIVSGGNIQLNMFGRCIDRALFIRQTRIELSAVLPYGTTYLSTLMDVLSKNHADVISCLSVPHVDTVANKEHYRIVIDVSTAESLTKIREECEKNGWSVTVDSTNALDE